MSFVSKMLVGTLLILLLSTIALPTNSLESCGCSLETIQSFNEDRIPATVPEWICSQPGIACGAKNMSTVNPKVNLCTF